MLGSDGMAVQVQAFQQALGSLCAALEPDSIPLPEVGQVWSRFDAIERLAAGAKCRLAARVEQS
nr:hypothetical protein [Actinomycetota bacterium]